MKVWMNKRNAELVLATEWWEPLKEFNTSVSTSISIEEDEKKEILYSFDTESCLMRMRFPKILFNIKAVFGEIGQLILEELIRPIRLAQKVPGLISMPQLLAKCLPLKTRCLERSLRK